MRFISAILCAIFLSFSSPAWATFVQEVHSEGGPVSSADLIFASNNAAGSLLIFRHASGGGVDVSTLTDTAGNTWIYIPTSAANSGGENHSYWYVKSAIGGPNTVHVVMTGTASDLVIAAFEYSGMAADPLDVALGAIQSPVGSTSADAVTIGPITTTAANDLVLVCAARIAGSGPATSGGTGFTVRANQYGDSPCEDATKATAGSISGTFTTDATDNGYMMSIVAFKAYVAPGAGVRYRSMVGFGQ